MTRVESRACVNDLFKVVDGIEDCCCRLIPNVGYWRTTGMVDSGYSS